MRKYLMIFAAFALLLVGCAQNEIIENRSEKNVIGFNTLNDKVTKSANADKDDYGVFAIWSENNSAWFMNDVQVDDNGNYSPAQYWPHGGTVSFFAYAPHIDNKKEGQDEGGSGTIAINADNVGKPVITYTVKDEADEDFTVAKPMTDKNKGSDNSNVHFEFNHMLSKLTVGAQLTEVLGEAGFTLDLSKASVELIVTENKRKIDLSSAPAWNEGYETAGDNLTYSHSFVFKTEGEGETATTTITNPSFMVMPQTTFAGETSKVSLQLKNVIVKKDGEIYWGDETGKDLAIYEFTGGEIASLDPNKHYAITITIGDAAAGEGNDPMFGDAITFTSDILDWDSVAGDDVGVNQPNDPTPAPEP